MLKLTKIHILFLVILFLFSTGTTCISPELSSAGKIVFTSQKVLNYDIYVMNADGSSIKRLTSHTSEDAQPSFSPDGNKIVFYSDRTGQNEIYIMNSDASNVKRLTYLESNSVHPCFAGKPR